MRCRALILIAFALTVASARAQPVPWPASGTPNCNATAFSGGRIQRGDPRKPAVLLIHGLGATADNTWIRPSTMGAHYDLGSDPGDASLGNHGRPGTGIWDIVLSDLKNSADIDSRNWFKVFADAGFTVAAFDQPAGRVGVAMPAVIAGYHCFLTETAARNPDAPPPVALVGHSRGGLIIRRLLNGFGTEGRIRWVFTIHSPHKGSELAMYPERATTGWADFNVGPLNPFRDQIKSAIVGGLGPVNALVGIGSNNSEMRPDDPLFASLENGESARAGVDYVTFGGTRPSFTNVYSRNFTVDSTFAIVDSLTPPASHYAWTVRPHKVGPVSPVFDKLTPRIDETTSGKGDGLVADARSRLPWSTHFTNELNHAEVLWDAAVPLQIVGRIASTPIPVTLTVRPRSTRLHAGGMQAFIVRPANTIFVAWSVAGPGSIDSNGVYHAPDPVGQQQAEATVTATAIDGSGLTASATVTLLPEPAPLGERAAGERPMLRELERRDYRPPCNIRDC